MRLKILFIHQWSCICSSLFLQRHAGHKPNRQTLVPSAGAPQIRVPRNVRNPLVETWFPCFFFQWFIMMFSNHGHGHVSFFFLNPTFKYTVHPYSFWRQRVLQPISCDVRHVPAEGVLSFMASVKLKDLCCAQWWKLPLKDDQKGLLQAICR